MKIKLNFLLFLIIFIILMSNVFAVGQSSKFDYNESGNFDNRYKLGLASAFTSLLDPAEINARTSSVIVSTGRKIPLISDLDGDGVAEIIILDGNTIEIYQNKTLDFTASFTLDTAVDERFSNIITFDIDGDGLREIILVAEKERELYILEYNRSVLVNQTRFQGTDLSVIGLIGGTESGEVVIKCSSKERCLMVYSSALDTGFTPGFTQTNTLYGQFFNSSMESINISYRGLLDESSSYSVFCQPNIRHISVADYDFDNGGATADPSEFEFISSNIEVELSGQESINVYWIDILSNNSVVLENKINNDIPGNILETTSGDNRFTCDNSAGYNVNNGGTGNPLFPGFYVTSPLVYDADFTEGGFETIIGMGKAFDDFIMVMFKQDGTQHDRFPATILGDSEGIMISNLFQADIFDDSTTDFCIMGFNGDPIGSIDDSLSVTCGSRTDSDGFRLFNIQSLEFRFNKAGLFNLSQSYDSLANLAHSIETDTSNNVDEVLSAYGILSLDLDSCSLLGDCDMDLIFAQPKNSNNPRVISTDAYDNFGSEDLIVLTDSNLFYLDDLLSNKPINKFCGESGSVTGSCIQYFINPCIKSIWKINTTVQIKMIPSDPEGDQTAIRARIYSNAGVITQDSGFVNVSSGAEFTISVNNVTGANFKANVSGGGFSLVLEAVDIEENSDDIETLTKSFSVAESGVETFDCTTAVTIGVDDVEVDVEVNATLTTDADVNAITSALTMVIGITGISGTTIWLVIMIVFALYIWFELVSRRDVSGGSALGVIAIVSAIMIILGARLEILSTGLVVIMTLIGIIIVGVFLGKFFFSESSA